MMREKFRSDAQYELARALHSWGIKAGTQEELEQRKAESMLSFMREGPKRQVIVELIKTPKEYGLDTTEIADVPGMSSAMARTLFSMNIVSVAQLAEFEGGEDRGLLRHRNYAKVKARYMEERVFQPYKVPHLYKLSDGLAGLHIDVSQISPEILDVLATTRLNILDLRYDDFTVTDPVLKTLRERKLLGRLQSLDSLLKHVQRVPFSNGEYALVHRK